MLAGTGCLIWCAIILGCGPSNGDPSDEDRTAQASGVHDDDGDDHEDHDENDHDEDTHWQDGDDSDQLPTDFPAAVADLQRTYEAIRDGFQADDLEKAHVPLHRVGELLEALQELADKADLSEQDLATAKSAGTAMFEAYGEIDGALHQGDKPDYAAVSDKLDKAMADLNEVVGRMERQ
jgi:hypothetical protein